MRLKDGISYIEFAERVKQCKADVYFDTKEGDHLNLKSTLSQFVFSVICGDKGLIGSGEIVCEDERDYAFLQVFLCQ